LSVRATSAQVSIVEKSLLGNALLDRFREALCVRNPKRKVDDFGNQSGSNSITTASGESKLDED
jgi:hypothetical protein